MINNDYYTKKIFLAQVDKRDNILGQIERWEAHEKGILHRGFTAILEYENNIYFQHRKHKAFDRVWDMTFSSHQIYKNDLLKSSDEAIYDSLAREWNLTEDQVSEIIPKGKIYYKDKDPGSIYTEHEVDYIYLVRLNCRPSPDLQFAYGIKEVKFSMKEINKFLENNPVGPWVTKMISEKMI